MIGIILSSQLILYFGSNSNFKNSSKNFQNYLLLFIACVEGIACLLMLMEKKLKNYINLKHFVCVSQMSKKQVILLLIMSLLTGLLLGATGVGGAVLVIPILILIIGMTPIEAVAGSIFIALILTLINSIIYFKGSQINIEVALVMWIGSIPGVYLGTRISKKISEFYLKRIIILLMILATSSMLIKSIISL